MSWSAFFSRDTAKVRKGGEKKLRLLFLGATESTRLVIRQLRQQMARHPLEGGLELQGILADEVQRGSSFAEVVVLGPLKELAFFVKQIAPNFLVICLEKFSRPQLQALIKAVDFTQLEVRIVPAKEDFLTVGALPRTALENLRHLRAEDLIGRRQLRYEADFMQRELREKTVLVTGAGGTIGSALCRKLLRYPLRELLCLSRSEHSLYLLKELLAPENVHKIKITYFLGNIKDLERLEEVVAYAKPQLLLHAAAHKHVLLMEENQKEAIKNNVFGTENLLALAQRQGIERFIFISTDKAVNPTNLMGLSKQLAEFLVRYYHQRYRLQTANLRFGNVIGSRGSVVPLFRKQMLVGGPITVTHPEVERYFMTVEEAAVLTLLVALGAAVPEEANQAAGATGWGRTYFLEMGRPVKIVDLVRELLWISGYTGRRSLAIEYTGLKMGEKLYEELVGRQEKIMATPNPQIHEVELAPAHLAARYEKYVALKKSFKTLESRQVKQAVRELLLGEG